MAAPRKYPQELRDRAIRLARESDRPLAHIARDLGVHPEALRNWMRQDEADRGERADQLSTVERDDVTSIHADTYERLTSTVTATATHPGAQSGTNQVARRVAKGSFKTAAIPYGSRRA